MAKHKTITPATGRDELLLNLINGATKGGTHTDRKKAQNKQACRGKVSAE